MHSCRTERLKATKEKPGCCQLFCGGAHSWVPGAQSTAKTFLSMKTHTQTQKETGREICARLSVLMYICLSMSIFFLYYAPVLSVTFVFLSIFCSVCPSCLSIHASVILSVSLYICHPTYTTSCLSFSVYFFCLFLIPCFSPHKLCLSICLSVSVCVCV